MAIGVGTGATVVFSSGSTFAGSVLGFTVDGEEVPSIDVSTLATTSYREKIKGTLTEPPQCTIELQFDPATPPPINVAATLTLTKGANTFAGTGFFISRTWEVPLEDKMTATCVFQFDGMTGPAFT
jgi:hypothetical protein